MIIKECEELTEKFRDHWHSTAKSKTFKPLSNASVGQKPEQDYREYLLNPSSRL